jgi:hypothetical protein
MHALVGRVQEGRIRFRIHELPERRIVGKITDKLAKSRKNQNNLLKIEK